MLEQEPGVIFVVRDEQGMKLDELADLCEYWKRHRESGRTLRQNHARNSKNRTLTDRRA